MRKKENIKIINNMPIQLNTVVPLKHGTKSINYFFSPKHRGKPTNEISVWDIDFDSEFLCFRNAFRNGWHNEDNAWSLLVDTNGLKILGRNLLNSELKLAKFVVDQEQWHGYPADIRNKPKDKPEPKILLIWYNKRIINKQLLTRIKQGQI